MRILADQNIPALEACFGHFGELRVVEGRTIAADDLRATDVLLVRSVTRVDEALLRGSPVQFVGTATAGLDHVDVPWLTKAGIEFAAAPGANANSVVEYVLAAMAAQAGVLERLLAGGRVGIVGYGHVGRLLRERLGALGIASLQYDPWLAEQLLPEPAQLADILACDVVSLHTSLTHTPPWPSHHLLGARELSALQGTTLLINASRGPVIDGAALLARLSAADAPRCVLDVWEFEPSVTPALLERVVLGTPHIAGYSVDAKVAATRQLAQALQQSLQQAPEQGPQIDAESAQQPGRLQPSQLPPALRVGELRDTALLRYLCTARYDIHADDRRLREAVLGAEEDDARRAFDRLRKNYPLRRELAGSPVETECEAQIKWVRALGAIAV
ncbi:MAG: 4-phosphoerythronate dehydrogenase [Haliea sp.]|nr:4-phosphoerythronate dehydrogenase [Haliea sp.]